MIQIEEKQLFYLMMDMFMLSPHLPNPHVASTYINRNIEELKSIDINKTQLDHSEKEIIIKSLEERLHSIDSDISGLQHRHDNPIGSDKNKQVKRTIKKRLIDLKTKQND